MKIDRTKLRNAMTSAKAKVSVVTSALVFSPFAFAQSTGGGGATGIGATVKALVEEYKAEALIAIIAMILVYWTLKATGVLKPR